MDGRPLPLGPGKSAPRLILDLLNHDPRTAKKSGKNLLADSAPQWRKGLSMVPHINACRHSLVRKDSQTRGPVSKDEQPDGNTEYVVSAYCILCRLHFGISVKFHPRQQTQVSCRLSDEANPLHHFRLTESTTGKEQVEKHGPNKHEPLIEAHRFSCTGTRCTAVLEIRISGPRLKNGLLDLITDKRRLNSRGLREIDRDPARYQGLGPVLPPMALWYLRSYLFDAKGARDPSQLKRIAKRNKKFVLSFADECDDVFTYLDFVQVEEPSELPEEAPNGFWQLPVINEDNRPFIDDVMLEIDMWLAQLPLQEQQASFMRVIARPVPALHDIERSLGYFEYPTKSRTVDLSKEEHPYYHSLGAVDNFTDELLSWAYDRQCQCDPANKPYYFDCLEDLAKGRESSDLQLKVTMALSVGEYGLKTLEEAYKHFGLTPSTQEGDDHIMGLYKSRIESAPKQKDQARDSLLVIARHRNSEKIEALAKDNSMTFEEALEFLNVSADTASDSIGAAAIVMSEDTDKTRVAQALHVIAQKRGNDFSLHRAAADMESDSGGSKLDVGEAYNRLQIGLAGRNAPDETILVYYNSLSNGAPSGSKDSYAEALRTIAYDRSSNFLLAKLDDPNADVQAGTAEPVGLDNIGNTCYLNSLLQYLYTIKPVRDMVMDFDNYRMELTPETLKAKRVGGRSVVKSEIIKAQKFVDELHDLFGNLKTASTRSITPTKRLAELTLISSQKEEEFLDRRKSISSPLGPPNIASIMSAPVYGPQWPPPPLASPPSSKTVEDDIEMVDNPNDNSAARDDSSEATLVDLEQIPSNDETEVKSDNQTLSDPSSEHKRQSIAEADSETDAVMVNGGNETEIPLSAPEKPPPIPPRNKSGLVITTTERIETIDEVAELLSFGAQQDVTEVMGNVTNRLQCAIKPTGFEEDSGEQIDIIRDTFFGTNTTYIEKGSMTETKVEAWPTILAYPGKNGVIRDIYETIDVIYDQQMVDAGNTKCPQYYSISKLPQILQIQIQRVDYDEILKVPYKNSTQVIFPETIYMDRYVATDDQDSAVMRRRRETWKWKAELRELEARQAALKNTAAEINVPDALIAVKDYIKALQEEEIEGIEIAPELPSALESRISEVAAELDEISKQIDVLKKSLREQFMDMREHEYKLHSVFIHRGEAGGGHYWVYIYDFEHDIWREYNDDHVTEVRDRRRIFDQTGGAFGTPYYLVYVQTNKLKDLVDVVCRDVQPQLLKETSEEQMDGVMLEVEEDSDVRHIEHAKPRPLRPKPPASKTINGWDMQGNLNDSSNLDANGKPW